MKNLSTNFEDTKNSVTFSSNTCVICVPEKNYQIGQFGSTITVFKTIFMTISKLQTGMSRGCDMNNHYTWIDKNNPINWIFSCQEVTGKEESLLKCSYVSVN